MVLLDINNRDIMSEADNSVYENPMWENARKALEAVSPQKGQNNHDQGDSSGNVMNNASTMSPQEMYYHQLNNYKQSFGPRPPPFGGGPPGYGMPPQNFPRPGFRGPPPPFGNDCPPDQSQGFNPRFMPGQHRPFFPPRNMQQNPNAGGIRFNIPKRSKIQQFEQNGNMNGKSGHEERPRFTGGQPNRTPPFRPQVPQERPRFAGGGQPFDFPNGSMDYTERQHNFENQSPWNSRKNNSNTEAQEQPPTSLTEPKQTEGKSISEAEAKAQMAATTDWPPNLRNWVQRAFASVPPEKKDKMEGILKVRLTAAFTAGTAFHTDWDKMPLPFEEKSQSDPAVKKSRWEANPVGRGRATPMSPAGHGQDHAQGHIPEVGQGPQTDEEEECLPQVEVVADFIPFSSGKKTGGRAGRGRGQHERARGRGRGQKGRKGFEEEPMDAFQQQALTSSQKKKGKQKNKNQRGKGKNLGGIQLEVDGQSSEKLMSRARRFGDQLESSKPRTKITIASSLNPINDHPEPSKIRPVEVLRRSIEMVKKDWAEKMDYHYACEQMKTIRQDLTGDHEEYNQCQTQLKNLYSQGLSGNRLEFTAYRILYYIYTSNLGDINSALTDLSQADRKDECIKHALDVRSAWALNNYHRFFQLYLNAPKMAGYLMDKFVGRIRKAALKSAVKAYYSRFQLSDRVVIFSYSQIHHAIGLWTSTVNPGPRHLLEPRPWH
ncbi:LENG8-like protein [Mya arenaria]|uniref:LENG8-like protein n=1 Tax=Mya arenaria TaxID=6604 RepID=A0ABY7DIM5_MYAAR|nr:LENG8-like protein [Mya arenaria]